MKPYIGVIPLYDTDKQSYWMIPGYMKGIEAAGGIPVMLPMTDNTEILESLTEKLDGFLFTGGQDVDPKIYGEEKIDECGEICSKRDSMEKKLLEIILEKDKPLLGICRGIQFINAVLGGTLYQDLNKQYLSSVEHTMKPPYNRTVHYVSVVEDTPLSELLNTKKLGVNSYHHQAVKELSPKLKAMAFADGLVEAVYMEDKKFVWAVQWHPELSFESDENAAAIFKEFTEVCRRKYTHNQ